MSTTVTDLVLTRAPTPFVFKLSSSSEIRPLVNRLDDILKRFKDYNDQLSQRLHPWGREVVEKVREYLATPEATGQGAQNLVSACCKALVEQILREPMTGAFLQNPLLDQAGHIWEKSIFDTWTAHSRNSPYERGQELSATPHEFAREIIDLTHHCLLIETGPNVEAALVAAPLGAPAMIQQLARTALSLQREVRRTRRAEELEAQLVVFMREERAATDAALIEIRVHSDAHVRASDARVSGIERMAQATQASLQRGLDQAQQHLRTTAEELRLTQTLVAQVQARANQLDLRLAQQQREIEEVRRESKSFCTVS